MSDTPLAPNQCMLIAYECMRLQNLYCLHADRNDVEAFVSLFAPEGSVEVPEAEAFVGSAAIRAAMQALVDTGLTHKHFASNHVVDALSTTSARGSCYLVVYASSAAPDQRGMRPLEQPSTAGHYDDSFVLTDAGWKFKSRVLTRTFRRGEAMPPPASNEVET